MTNIVIIGGGTGTSTLLKGLKNYRVNLSVIVSTADDGGSSGILRKEMGVLPPGDMRQCLVALSQKPSLAENFNYRYPYGSLKGHTIGNLVLANFEKTYGINKALDLVGKFLKVKGQVLPVTLKPTLLSAILENGKRIIGEHNIDESSTRLKIKDLRLKPNGPANPKALEAIKSADAIIFGPGDLFTSTIPNLLVKGVAEAVKKSSAKKIFITNIMTKFGQTDGFKVSDFVKVLEKYLGEKIDFVLVNNKKPGAQVLQKYAKEKAKVVESDVKNLAKMKVEVVVKDLISNDIIKKEDGDKLKRSLIRHDSKKLAKLIMKIL